MIILSIGMPRAGSGWYYNLTNDLMLASGAQDARQIRKRYHLENILTEVNCNIGAFTTRRVVAVLVPSILGNTFVIKAHAGPTSAIRLAMRRSLARAAYIYRDPRDAMLSAMENGRRALEAGRTNAFSPLAEFDAALSYMKGYMRVCEDWIQEKAALHARYEDLLIGYDAEALRLVQFLGLDCNQPSIQSIIERYRPEKGQSDQKGLHFSQGKIGRFRSKMTPEQQEIMADALGPSLQRMGYEI